MAVRFVIGRSGVGKTHHCLSAIRDALRRSPLDGPRLILLVPEQISLEMERSLLSDSSVTASHRAEVFSFRRLAFRVLADCGDDGRTALSPAARTMLIRLILTRHAPELRYYRRPDRFNGFIERLAGTFTELIQESNTPDDLTLENEEAGANPARRLKLHDIRLLYRAYLQALGPDRLDPSQYLDAARERLSRCRWLHGSLVWIDGFAGFSRQERRMLVELARWAEHVDITALIDPDDDTSRPVELFSKTRRMTEDLSNTLLEHSVALETPLALRAPPRRFERSPALAQIEAHLFAAPPIKPAPANSVHLIRAPDRRAEVEYVTSRILALVQRPTSPLRYRDIAVITRDLEPYHTLVAASFSARAIPYFIDRRRAIAHHPLAELIRSLIELARDDFSTESVRTLLRTGLIGLADAECDILENAVLAAAPTGRNAWVGATWSLHRRRQAELTNWQIESNRRVNEIRARFVALIDPWVRTALSNTLTMPQWAHSLRQALERQSAIATIEDWIARAEQDGDVDVAESHRQVLRDVFAFLEDIEHTPSDGPVSLGELCPIIDAGLAQLTLGLAPPMLDQVLVGQIERSRQPEIKVAFVVGANDGAFPAIPDEDPIFPDEEREWLANHGIALAPSRRRRILDEAQLFYIAATRAADELYVSYCDADVNQKELRPSPYINALCEACPGLREETITQPFGAREDWAILAPTDLAAHLAFEFRARPDRKTDDFAVRGKWNDLYDTARADTELAPMLNSAARSLVYDNAATLRDSAPGYDHSQPLTASVSQLESYAACPFQHFAQYRLRLQRRDLSPLDDPDLGTLHHAVLDQFLHTLREQRISFGSLPESEITALLNRSAQHVRQVNPMMSGLSQAKDKYISRRMETELQPVLRLQQQVTLAGAFKPLDTEVPFGYPETGIDGLALTTPKGRRLVLRGRIDRIDVADVSGELLGIVIDYKRTAKKNLDLSSAYHGFSLQLLTYLLVLEQSGRTLAGKPVRAAGAFFVPLLTSYQKVDRPDDSVDALPKKSPHRPRGILDYSKLDAFDPAVAPGSPSQYFAVSINKSDGAIGRIDQSDAAPPSALARLLAHTSEQLAALADKLLDGAIDVSPYRLRTYSPCTWCLFHSVCRFDQQSSPIRYFPPLRRSEVFALLSVSDSGTLQ